MKKHLLLISLLLLFITTSKAAITISPDITFTTGDIKYRFTTTFTVDSIRINNSYLLLNNHTKFIITPSSPGTVYVNITTTRHFNASFSTPTAKVWFNISGFTPNQGYTIRVDGTPYTTVKANSSGFIHFNYSGWSEHEFTISSATGLIKVEGTREYTSPFDVMTSVAVLFGIALIIGLLMFMLYRMRGEVR